MFRRAATCTFLAILVISASTADARELFRRVRAEELAPPQEVVYAQRAPYQSAQKTPYRVAQKSPYQVAQKGVYQKGNVATCVSYVQHRPHKKICCDCASYTTTIAVYDPCSCGTVDVPICVPGCCKGSPTTSSRAGLLGRGITTYSWCCGYTVRVVVTRRGAVTVHYYGS